MCYLKWRCKILSCLSTSSSQAFMSRWNEMGLTLLDGAAVEAERPFTPCFNAPSPLGASLESGIITHPWISYHLSGTGTFVLSMVLAVRNSVSRDFQICDFGWCHRLAPKCACGNAKTAKVTNLLVSPADRTSPSHPVPRTVGGQAAVGGRGGPSRQTPAACYACRRRAGCPPMGRY